MKFRSLIKYEILSAMKKLSWEDVDRMTNELCEKIKSSDFQPDRIIGITAGGLIPLYFVAKKLEITDRILTLSASSYTGHEKRALTITYLPEIDLSGKNVLLIDEIAETGATLKGISNAVLEKYNLGSL